MIRLSPIGPVTAMLLAVHLFVPAPAGAAGPAPAPTHLTLQETAEARVAGDRLIVTLRAETRGPDAAEVQGRLNRQMAAALARSKAVDGLVVSTGTYTVQEVVAPEEGAKPGKRGWLAAQSLSLESPAERSAALLALAGALQNDGLMISSTGSALSVETRRAVEDRLVREAIGQVRGQAETAAGALGLAVTGIRAVRIDRGGAPHPVMMRAAGDTMMAKAMVAPSVEPADLRVSVSVDAEFDLAAP
jgi:predicted secreted protein